MFMIFWGCQGGICLKDMHFCEWEWSIQEVGFLCKRPSKIAYAVNFSQATLWLPESYTLLPQAYKCDYLYAPFLDVTRFRSGAFL